MRGGRLVGTVIAIAVAVSSLGLLVGSSPAVAAPIELVERRTAYSKTFQNDDGTETLELSGRPLHYQNDAGHWVDVDVRLEAELGPDYSYSAKKNRPKVWLPRKASQAARFEVGQHYLRFQPVGAADADVIRRDETTVAFSGVWQNTDLSYQVIPEGLKENIVIQSRPSPTTFPFELDYPGVSPQLESDGSIAFLSAETGEELWRFPRPYAVEMREGASPSYEAVRYQLQQRGTAATVSLVVDPQWLDNPARQFPVLIDPTTVSLGSGSESRSITTYASQTVTYWWRLEAPACMGTDRYGKVKIGTWSGGGNILDKSISNTLSSSGKTEEGSGSFTASPNQTFYLTTDAGWYWWGIWPFTHHGSGAAYLRVTYVPYHAPTTSVYSPSASQWLKTGSPSYSWTYQNQDGQAMTKYQLQVASNSSFTSQLKDTGEVSYTSSSGGTVTASPGWTLADGTWYWRVKVFGGELWSDWSSPNAFRIDTTPPSPGAFSWALLPYPQHGTSIAWDPFTDSGSGVSNYVIYRDLNQGAGYEFLVERDPNTRNAQVELSPDVLPYNWPVNYKITAHDVVGNESSAIVETATEAAWTTIDTSAVTFKSNSAGAYTATIGIVPAVASGYQVRRTNQSGQSFTSDWQTDTTFVDPGPLEPHAMYAYSVRTRNFKGLALGQFGTGKDVTVKNSAPSQVTPIRPADGAVVSTSTVTLEATQATDLDGDSLQYKFVWSNDPSGPWSSGTDWLPLPTAAASSLGDGTYFWKVFVSDGYVAQPLESGPFSFSLDTAPPTLSFQLNEGQPYTKTNAVTLGAFVTTDPGGRGIAKIRLRNQDPTGQGAWTELTWPLELPVQWTLPAGDGPKVVEAQALDLAGNWSDIVSAQITLDTAGPATPQVTSVTGGVGQVEVVWDGVTDAGSGLAGYQVEYLLDGASQWKPVAAVGTTARLEGLGDNQLVSFRVRAADQLGNESAWSTATDGCSLASPAVATATAGYTSTDGHFLTFAVVQGLATSYAVEPLNPVPGHRLEALPGGLTFRDYGLAAHTRYDYQIVSHNRLDEPRATVVTTATVNNQPSITGTLTPSGFTTGRVTFAQDFASDPDGDLLAYQYHVTDPAGNELPVDSLNPTLSGLSEGATYTWYAEVSDGFGGSVTSAAAQFTVDVTPPTVTLSNTSSEWATTQVTTITAADGGSGVAQTLYAWNAVPSLEYTGGELSAPEGYNTLSVKAIDRVGNETTVSQVYKVDTSAPVVSRPVVSAVGSGTGEPYVGSNTEVSATWEMSDDETGVASYAWAITTDPVAPVALTLGTVISRSGQYTDVFRAPLTDGLQYYLIIEAVNSLGLKTRVISDPFMIDASAPEITGLQLTGPISLNGALAIDNLAKLSLQASIADSQSQIAAVEYALLTSPDAGQATDWRPDLASLDLANQPSGRVYYLAIRARNEAGLESTAVCPGVLLDSTPPEITSLLDEGESKRDKTSLAVSVKAVDAETGILRYRYAVGTAPGQTDVSAGLPGNEEGWLTLAAPSPDLDIVISDLDLADGTFYVTLQAVNGVGLTSQSVSTDGIRIDSSLKPAPSVTDDGAFTADTRELHVTWTYSEPQLISGYAYRVLQRNPADGSLSPLCDWRQQTPGGGTEDLIITAEGPTGLGLVHGLTYFAEVKAVYPDGTESATGRTNGITVDLTHPQNLLIADGNYAPKDRWVVSWSATDPESGIVGFKYAVGTTRGGTDVTGGLISVGKATAVTIAPERLVQGGLYFVTVVALNGAGLEAQAASDGTIIDSTPPPTPRVLDSGAYTNNATSLSASWTWTGQDPESGPVKYEYAILTERKVSSLTEWIPLGTETRLAAGGLALADGQTYFVAVRATNGAGLTAVGFSDGILVDTTAPNPPSVDDGGDYTTSKTQLSATFVKSVDPESGILNHRYSVGTVDSPVSVVPLTELTGTRVDLTNLRLAEGTVYFFYVEAVNNAGLVSATAMSDGIMVESGYPEIGPVVDEGKFTRSAAEVHASWTAAAPPSGTAAYEYALVTDPNATPVSWKNDPANPLLRSVVITGPSVTDGTTRYVLVRGRSVAGAYTPPDKWGRSDGITVDTSPPPLPLVADAGAFTAQTLKVHVEAQDPHSGIAGYRYAVGTTRGGWDVTGTWVDLSSTEGRLDLELANLPLIHVKTYYVAVKAQNGAGNWSETAKTDGITADLTPPTAPVVTYPGSYVRSRSVLTGAAWQSGDPETGIAAYRYGLTTDPAQPVFGPEIPHTSAQGTLNLTDLTLVEGRTYYLAVRTRNGVGSWSPAGVSQGITVDTIAPAVTFAAGGTELVTNSGQLEIAWSTSEAGQFTATVTRPNGTTWTSGGGVGAGTHSLAVSETLEGKYTVRLQVTDAAGNTSAAAEQPFRLNAKPQVNAGLDSTVRKGEPFALKPQVTDPDGTIAAYKWEFGDGTTPAEQAEPTHAYPQLGVYTVTLTVTDNDGGTATGTLKVTVTNSSQGTLYLDETWDTPMTITGDVTVPAGITLTIAAGTPVTFAAGTGLAVQGRLVVAGEEGKPVTLSGATASPGFWKGVTLSHSTAENSLVWATIRDAGRGLTVVASPATIRKTTFQGNELGLHAYAAAPQIDACAFLDNAVYGLKEDAGAIPLVTNSQFSGNRAGPYYDETETIITVERLNELGANAGNF